MNITIYNPPVCQTHATKLFHLASRRTKMRMEASYFQVSVSFSTLGSLGNPYYLVMI